MDKTSQINPLGNSQPLRSATFPGSAPSADTRTNLAGSLPIPEVVSDQASRLRQMAGPGKIPSAQVGLKSAKGFPHNPRVLLISEFPVLHTGFSLAWELSQQLSSKGGSTVLVDLAPAASRLPDHLREINTPATRSALASQQTLWSDAPHGRGLTSWDTPTPGTVKLIAQPPGPFPSTEQMPRICEQFLRSLDNNHRQPREDSSVWSTVIVVSEVQGIPLDSSCWQAADEILFLMPKNLGQTAQAEAALAARLRVGSTMQRRIAIWKSVRSSWNWWGNGRWNSRRVDRSASNCGVVKSPHFQRMGFEDRLLDCAPGDAPGDFSSSQLRSLSRFASSLVK